MIPDFVVSDTHFFHQNLIKYVGRPDNHVELMIENWQRVVGPDNTVLNLGDVLMGRRDLWPLLPKLPGRVSVLDSGNHDEPHKRKFMEENWGWVFVPEYEIRYRGWRVLFSHRPAGTQETIGAQDNTYVEVVKPLGKRTMSVHGHVHGQPDVSPNHLNVCVERINYTPARLTDLLDSRIELLRKR